MNPDTPETKVCLVCHRYHVYILYKNPTDSYCLFWCVKTAVRFKIIDHVRGNNS